MLRRIKLVYITNQICGSGGLERVLSIKASYLAEKLNYEVHIITLNQGTAPLFYNFSPKITYHDIKTKDHKLIHAYKYITGLKKTIKQINPDIISVCDDGLKGFFVPWVINKPCPMVYERHVSKNIEVKSEKPTIIQAFKTWVTFKLMDLGATQYDQFVVLTQGNTKEWHNKNLKIIPNPLSFFPKSNDLSTLTNKKVIAVGKQCFQKGYDRLLQAWKLIHHKHPDWQLDIYGTINKSEGLGELATNLGIAQSVNFYDPVKNIADKYQEASIYAMSSRYEGFGMVLIEAMSYGVPCVSFDCPYGPSDIITHNKDGYLVKNGAINLLAERIDNLIADQTLRTNMGKNARKHVERFLPDVIVPQWDKLFNDLTTHTAS